MFVAERLPVNTPVFGGSGYAVQTFRSAALEPRDPPCKYTYPRPFQIRWALGAPEGPSWEDAYGLGGHELVADFVKEPDCFKAYYDRYAPRHATKVGGWPSYIQGAPAQQGVFVFQIDSEEKAQWMIGDNGTMYFFRDDGQWGVHWDCY